MKRIAVLVLLLMLIGIVSAVPTTGSASGTTSNGFNTTLSGITGSEVWVEWGDYPGRENWKSAVTYTSNASETIQVIGAPIYGGETIYFQGCDSTGCGNEESVTISTVTIMPTMTLSKLVKNITQSRWDPTVIGTSLVQGYTTVTSSTVLFGIAFLFLMIGVWMRTKSVRLIAVIGIIISPFIMYGSQGLYLGVPLIGQGIAQGLLAAGLAGVLLSFIRK